MTNLILVHPEDDLNVTKTIIDIDNWRAIGRMANKKFYLIASDCDVYHINNLTITKFVSAIKMGLDLTVKGVIDTIALMCPDCGGSGITDWVSVAMPKKIENEGYKTNFKRDKNSPVLKTKNYVSTQPFTIYFSRAIVPPTQQYCKTCQGTGLFIIDIIAKDLKEEITKYKL